MSTRTSLASSITDIIVHDQNDPFFTAAGTSEPSSVEIVSIDPEQALVDSLERAMLAIVATAVSLLVAALLGNGARADILAQDGSILCGAVALLAASVAIFSTLQSLARFLGLFRSQSADDVLGWRVISGTATSDTQPSWDPP